MTVRELCGNVGRKVPLAAGAARCVFVEVSGAAPLGTTDRSPGETADRGRGSIEVRAGVENVRVLGNPHPRSSAPAAANLSEGGEDALTEGAGTLTGGVAAMAKKVSLINMKGGVGKSTLTVNLAWQFAALSTWNKKVLVVDLDPQFNASQYLIGVRKYEDVLNKEIPTVWNVFEQLTYAPGGKTPAPIDPQSVLFNITTYHDGSRIDLIPSRLELAYSLTSPGQKADLLAKLVAKIEDRYDLILIDCAPTESFLTTAAYLASDYILVPVKPEYLSTIGLPLLVRSMREFKQHYDDHNLELAGVVFNATTGYAPEEVKSKREVKAIAEKNRWYIFKSEVTYSRSYPKGAREGQPIFNTSYSRTAPARQFHAFAEEFAERVGL